ncbi:MAG: helix-turn-helix transcriptional regulator [Oscillospiraceae bacterium]|nr:helix-turn-helix transcriptional regulator [Oscillospiraceae bacterium]
MAEAESFNRILTLLRKERGITQKEAAASLGVSQALLSHYEKGIRECGLSFVVRAARFYGVSCDYLLGLSPDPSGLTLSIEELPEGDSSEDGHYKGSVLPVFNKKLLANSLAVLYDILLKSPDKGLVGNISAYLMTALYKMFRLIYSANPKNADSLFSVPRALWSGYADAALKTSEARVEAILSGEKIAGIESFEGVEKLRLTSESLSESYPQLASSLFNVIQQAEKEMQQ